MPLIIAGLTHRRERRRKKRAVVEIPKESISPGRGEDGTDDQATETTRAGRKAQKVKKQSAGYALMHGFAATNVGKGRLTASSWSPFVHSLLSYRVP